jgi:zinc transport system substrate-binding protein
MRSASAILATWMLLTAIATAPAGCRRSSQSETAGGATVGPSARAGEEDDRWPPAVSNPYLAAALRDLLGDDTPLVLLAEPGACPGHFDLRPSQMRQLRSGGLLVRFDFQQALDARLDRSAAAPDVATVAVPGGMCEPESYLSACRQLADALVARGRLSRGEADARLAGISARMDDLADWAAHEIDAAGLRGAKVLSSARQAAFCRRLGLDVVATFSAVDTAQPSQIDRAVRAGEQAGVALVVVNLPEGRQLADALADRLGARVVVFGNFPDGQDSQAFDQLVCRNVAALAQGTTSPAEAAQP